jgi:hypothetical protein
MTIEEISEQTGAKVKTLEKHRKEHPEHFQKKVVKQLKDLPKIDFDNFVPKGLWVTLDKNRMICEEGLLLQTKKTNYKQKEVGTIYRPSVVLLCTSNRLQTYRYIYDLNWKPCRFSRVLWEVFNGEIDKNKVIDHINENSIDDRLDNYQELSNRRNIAKGIEHIGNASSKYTGVCWDESTKKWKAQIHINGKWYYIGLFTDEIEAAKAWDERARKEDLPEDGMNFRKESTFPEKMCQIVT